MNSLIVDHQVVDKGQRLPPTTSLLAAAPGSLGRPRQLTRSRQNLGPAGAVEPSCQKVSLKEAPYCIVSVVESAP